MLIKNLKWFTVKRNAPQQRVALATNQKELLVKYFIGVMTSLALIMLFILWFVFFSARPALTIDPAVLAGDGSLINYCQLPILDNSGKLAADIPKANTPGCSYDHFPLPILSACTETLPTDADDIRGLWIGVTGKVGHVERIEQCGARVVVTSSGIIHDLGPNSTSSHNSNDTEGGVLFTIGDQEYCPRTSAGALWNKGVLNFRVLGWGPIVVKRYREDEQLVWEYADGSTTRMKRLCKLPATQKIPQARGPRIAIGL
jgi:hypothetical protein